MKAIERKTHWETIYQTKAPTAVSWYQEHPDKSLELIARSRVFKSGRIIDVGGGASTLVDHLIERNYLDVTVLDISGASLQCAQERLGENSNKVKWIEADILQEKLPNEYFDLWHDRAVFHFLTDKEDRQIYINQMDRSVKTGGHVIIATFAIEGPLRCSGLDVVRYGPETLCKELGEKFSLIENQSEEHSTPFDSVQKFNYCLFRKKTP
jgi:ubiquinone/menaquinone biosynthesis C-methylase UbiE